MKRSSLRCPIPEAMRESLSQEKFMKTCCLASEECQGRIQWHHNLVYASKRINEPWAILPLCEFHHRVESTFKGKLNRIMVERASEEQLAPYCKSTNYILLKRSLVVK